MAHFLGEALPMSGLGRSSDSGVRRPSGPCVVRAEARRALVHPDIADRLDTSSAVGSAANSVAAREHFAKHYGLAVSLARRYWKPATSGGSADDLEQVALLALVHAADRFDPERGVPFAAFACTTIVGELKHYLRDQCWMVRPPRRIQELFLRSQEAIGELTQELGRPPTPAEVAQRVGALAADVEEAMNAGGLRRLVSLDAAPRGDDRPPADVTPIDDRTLVAVEDRLALRWLLSRLPERERRVVRCYYLDGRTQQEIADAMGVSQAHVQRLLARSLDQMRVLGKAS